MSYASPSRIPGIDDRRHICTDRSLQPVRAVYTRMGTPAKWTKLGKVCLNCSQFWPEQRPLL
jgi:hypothetical protein